MSDTQYNVGVIGYGWAATAHIDAINGTNQGTVKAVYSSRELNAADLKATHGSDIKPYRSVDEMLADGKTNWNTDFIVNKPYASYKFFFTANSSDPSAQYPVEAYMKFTDGSSLQVVNTRMSPPMGTGKMFGPFPAVAGKQASQMNFKVGASDDPGALGFSYRISVQGCR